MNYLENYKEEIRLYQIWLKKMKKTYGENSLPIESWSNHDYDEALQRNYGLKMVEKVLNLSKEQIDEIWNTVEKELQNEKEV